MLAFRLLELVQTRILPLFIIFCQGWEKIVEVIQDHSPSFPFLLILLWLSPSIKIRTARATWQKHIPSIRPGFLFAIDRHRENGGSGETAVFEKFFLNAFSLLLHHAG